MNIFMQRQQLIPHVASTINSYMKEHNVSMEVAREEIYKLKEDVWKDFNSEWLNAENDYPKQLLERIFNLTRTMEFQYNREEKYVNSYIIKDTIHMLLVVCSYTHVSCLYRSLCSCLYKYRCLFCCNISSATLVAVKLEL